MSPAAKALSLNCHVPLMEQIILRLRLPTHLLYPRVQHYITIQVRGRQLKYSVHKLGKLYALAFLQSCTKT